MHYEGSVSSNSVEDIRAKAARSTNEMEQHLDFDDLLPEIGEFGCFQKVLFVLMIPFCYISAFVYLSQIFMTLPPDKYYCFVNELSLIASEEERKQLSIPKEADGSYSRCQMYDVNYTAVFKSKNRSELINSSLPLIPCREGYVFDRNEPFRTATMEFGWVCANDRYATYAQVIFFLGSVAGCLAYGHFADHCGRVAALVSSCSLAFFGSIFTSMATDFVSFVIIRLIVGASFDTCFTMIYILGTQQLTYNDLLPELRPKEASLKHLNLAKPIRLSVRARRLQKLKTWIFQINIRPYAQRACHFTQISLLISKISIIIGFETCLLRHISRIVRAIDPSLV